MALEFRKSTVVADEQVKDALNEVQDSILDVVRKLNDQPTVNGVLVENQSLGTTSSLVLHDLGYEPKGWLAVNKTANFEIYEDTAASNPDRRRFLNLRTSSGSYTLNIYIF